MSPKRDGGGKGKGLDHGEVVDPVDGRLGRGGGVVGGREGGHGSRGLRVSSGSVSRAHHSTGEREARLRRRGTDGKTGEV